MIKVKLIEVPLNTEQSFVDAINSWLVNNQERCKILDVKYQMIGSDYMRRYRSALIIYDQIAE